MRRSAVLLAVIALAACGSHAHTSKLFATTVRRHLPAAGSGTLVQTGHRVVGKALVVVGIVRGDLVVRNPHGGTLILAGRRPATPGTEKAGDLVSFAGRRSGSTVEVSKLSVVQRRAQ